MPSKYRVTLTLEEREELEALSTKGRHAARTVQHARALLLVDRGEHGPGWTVGRTAEAVGLSPRSIDHLKKRFVEQGLQAAVNRKKRVKPPREIQFGGEFEAQLIALACTEPPEGRARWTVRLLAEKLVELDIVPSVSPMTVCTTLKKTNFSLTAVNTGRSRRIKTRRS